MECSYLKLIKIYILAGIFLVLCSGIVSAETDMFRDSENCLLCHGYPTLGKQTKSGEARVFYINGNEYARTVHGRLRCTNCHLGLDRIPHTDIKKVDCSTKCHIHGSAPYREVSHKDVVKKYEASVHGKATEDHPKALAEDLPTCTYCHTNRDYNYSENPSTKSRNSSDKAISAFRHPLSELRSQIDVIKLCASCHEDREKMARHGLESIETYKDTFHWEQMKYGVEDSPDCISCHVPMGYSSHTIRPGGDPVSPVNIKNRIKTCSNKGGIQTCHPDATAEFANGRVHTYGVKAQLATGEKVFDVEGRFNLLMAKEARDDIPEKEILHYKILKLIKLIYKILIGCTIGFMSFHQLLDYMRARKKHKMSH